MDLSNLTITESFGCGLVYGSVQKWATKHFQSLPLSTASLVVWPCKPLPQSVSPDSEKQGTQAFVLTIIIWVFALFILVTVSL
jgi:hypothetical protein